MWVSFVKNIKTLSTVYGVIYDFFRFFELFLCNNVLDLDVPVTGAILVF